MSVPERVLVLVGAVVASAIIWFAMVVPGLSVLNALPDRAVERTGIIGLSSEGSATGLWGWVFARELPTLDDSESVVVSFISSVATLDEDNSPSFLLTGAVADGLITCTGAGVSVALSLSYAELTLTEQEMLTTQAVYPATYGYINHNNSEAVATRAEASASLANQTFVRLTPDISYFEDDENRTAEVKDKAIRTYEAKQATFTCSFEPSTFWSQTGGTRVFTFPEAVAEISTADDEKYLYLQQDVSFAPDDGSVFRSSDVVPNNTTSENVAFSGWTRSWDGQVMVSVVRGPTVVFEEVEESQAEERKLFVAGAGVAVLGALLIATSKILAEFLLPLLQLVRRRLIGPGLAAMLGLFRRLKHSWDEL